MSFHRKRASPSISIAIPVFNQAATIEATIESAIQAAEGHLCAEIVISENHSNDGTAELVDRYASRVRIVRPNSHLGMVANWNHAVHCCTNSWVGMLSGDDKIYANYIPEIRKIIMRNSDAVFAMGGWSNLNTKDGKKTRRRILSVPSYMPSEKATAALLNGPKACFSSYSFNKEAFLLVGGFPVEYCSADYLLQFKLALIGSFVKTDKIISEYLSGQDRPDIDAKRAPLLLRDVATLCSKDIWEARKKGITNSDIIHACTGHLSRGEWLMQRYPAIRVEGQDVLRPAYEKLGQEIVLEAAKRPSRSSLGPVSVLARRAIEKLIPG